MERGTRVLHLVTSVTHVTGYMINQVTLGDPILSTICKGDTGKSAIAEHQWDQQHQVNWEDTRVLDRASRPVQLGVKEALYIQKTPTNNRLNRDEGYELPGCWIATVKKLGGGVSSSRASANHVSAWTSAPVSQRICSGPRICSAGIHSLADLFRISRKSADLFRMGSGRCFFDTGATRVKVLVPF